MAEILVFNRNKTHLDPFMTVAAMGKRGDIVSIREDGFLWGTMETLPDWVLVKVPGLDPSVMDDQQGDWRLDLSMSVESLDPVTDSVILVASITNPGADYGITRAQVETFVNNWSGEVLSASANSVRIQLSVQGVYKSFNFWGTSPLLVGVTITEVDYNQTTGVHRAEIDTTNATIGFDKILNAVIDSEPLLVIVNGPVITVDFGRDQIKEYFVDQMKRKMQTSVRKFRYRFSEADMDLGVSLGGVVTLTPAQLQNKVLDKAAL